MSVPLRVALAVVLCLGFSKISMELIAPPWHRVCSFIGGAAIGFLMARAK